jgi:hypothetical protein
MLLHDLGIVFLSPHCNDPPNPIIILPAAMTSSQRLPFDQSLFVATSDTIHLRSQLARKTLFECSTANGIVNARASKDNSSLFAVADGQVVILHDAMRSKDRKYKLKNGDV